MSSQTDIIIIGAGIVGMATAFRLLQAQPGLKIRVLEKEPGIARHQTGHNSGVIHSGIYYRPGTLRARNCLDGYQQLLSFCQQYDIPYDLCGKVIVATQASELPQLEAIYQRGLANGLKDLKVIGPEAVREIEPHVRAVQAIWVPQAGIIHYPAVAAQYQRLISRFDAAVITDAAVTDIQIREKEVVVNTTAAEYSARQVINCAGLYADKIARLTQSKLPLRIIPFRGEYYMLSKEREHLVNNLIYPVPDPNFPFLGVHYTRMIKGGIEAGPNAVLAFRREGYSRWDIHPGELAETLSFRGFQRLAGKYARTGLGELYRSFSKSAFVKALQHLIPEVGYNDLTRGGSGVRAMAVNTQGQIIDDFVIEAQPRVVNVLSAPSPAATASLAIGQTIAQRALEVLP